MFGGNYCRRFEHGACIADRKKAGKFFRSERFGFGCHHPTMPSFVHWNVFKFAQKSENTAISGGLPLPCALAPLPPALHGLIRRKVACIWNAIPSGGLVLFTEIPQ
jgi:hypothetical protein